MSIATTTENVRTTAPEQQEKTLKQTVFECANVFPYPSQGLGRMVWFWLS